MSYVKNLAGYKEKVRAETMKSFKGFLQDMYVQVAMDTPVDTGRAQSSWWLTQPGKMPHPVEGQGIRTPPSLYWMTWKNHNVDLVNPNNYVKYLNEGWSRQAPPKFVERAIARAVRNAT